VLYTDVDTLLDVSVANDFVYDDTDGVGRDVVDNASATVVVFMGHTLLLGRVRLDVDDISNTIVQEVGGQFHLTMFLESLLEHMARTRAVTE